VSNNQSQRRTDRTGQCQLDKRHHLPYPSCDASSTTPHSHREWSWKAYHCRSLQTTRCVAPRPPTAREQGAEIHLLVMTDLHRLTTGRLVLVPATAPLLRAEIEQPRIFFHSLGVQAIDDWPPEDLADVLPLFHAQLERHPDLTGWLSWYWVLRPGDASVLRSSNLSSDRAPGSPAPGILIGSGGFKGRPEDGRVEIGYYVREAHRRRGYATEALRALLPWALAHAEVSDVIAETATDNTASTGLLEKLGFALVGDGSRPGLIRFAAQALVP
jgi:ribosomal-protein-alanine N-acetyltransferase